MHQIEPYYNWDKYYVSTEDTNGPFYNKEYIITEYTNNIYGYYIHPLWDFFGSETLYLKVIYADYTQNTVIIELLGEWNDTLHNDIMHFKRNIADHFRKKGIQNYILIGENVLNFHGSDDCYYEEWFEDVEDGWIVGLNFREHVVQEMEKYNIDSYINFGGRFDSFSWRNKKPQKLTEEVESLVMRRLSFS